MSLRVYPVFTPDPTAIVDLHKPPSPTHIAMIKSHHTIERVYVHHNPPPLVNPALTFTSSRPNQARAALAFTIDP